MCLHVWLAMRLATRCAQAHALAVHEKCPGMACRHALAHGSTGGVRNLPTAGASRSFQGPAVHRAPLPHVPDVVRGGAVGAALLRLTCGAARNCARPFPSRCQPHKGPCVCLKDQWQIPWSHSNMRGSTSMQAYMYVDDELFVQDAWTPHTLILTFAMRVRHLHGKA